MEILCTEKVTSTFHVEYYCQNRLEIDRFYLFYFEISTGERSVTQTYVLIKQPLLTGFPLLVRSATKSTPRGNNSQLGSF